MATLAKEVLERTSEIPARITESEYVAMCEAGVFGDDHVELNRGVLERKAPSGLEHGSSMVDLITQLRLSYDRDRYVVAADTLIRLAADKLRAPDILVARTPVAGSIVPSEAAILVVELARQSKMFDLGPKARDYAAAAIPHYWVVDLIDRVTHLHTRPASGSYSAVDRAPFGQPLRLPELDRTVVLD